MLKNIFAVVFALSCAGAIFAQSGSTGQKSNQPGALNVIKSVVSDKDLVIPFQEITGNAVFYPVDVEGTRMEVLAVRAPDGSIRTAFNTCQVCYSSGRGFYKQQASFLVCQNCGNRFRMNQVGVKSGGCNPAPITEANRVQNGDSLTISYKFLKEAKSIFAKWRRV
jgi:uncharacterized membrane protein